MSISAMKQALEALEGLWDDGFGGVPESMHKDAITALRQAIAEAEKPKMRRATREEKIVNPGVYEVPVHASDISQERVDETAKHRHEPTPWEGIRETVELRGSHSEEYEEGFWAGLRAYEDKLREQDWYGQHQWQCGYERGWDAAMERKREWVGLTDEKELWEMWVESISDVFRFARAIEAKLKEKNT